MSGVMIMAGGTGGHVFPALAVAEKLQLMNVPVTWLGTRKGLEAQVVPANNIRIEWITINGLRGKGTLSWLLSPIKLVRAMWQSFFAIRRVKPDCILGMGGFVSGPGGVMGRLMGKPLIIHEQNAVAGLTNKYLAKIASDVLTGFPNVDGMPSTAKWVGNPVRPSIKASIIPPKNPLQVSSNASSDMINILILGGSQGAHSFNSQLPELLINQFHSGVNEINIWHQTGKGRNADVEAAYLSSVEQHSSEHGGLRASDKANYKGRYTTNYKVTEFIDDMASAYEWADLLICRAGAMTVAECCAAAKPALLVPYPFSAGDHQDANAMTMVNHGAGVMVANDQLTTDVFIEALTQLLSSKTNLQKMGEKAYLLHKPDALQQVLNVCEEYCHA